MKKTKVIHLINHLPPDYLYSRFKNPEEYFTSPEKGKYHIINEYPYWIGFFSLDHAAIAAKELLSRTDNFDVECWRPYGFGLNEPRMEVIDGILYRVFPAIRYYIPQFGEMIWSETLYQLLIEEIINNQVILNLSFNHSYFNFYLIYKLRKFKEKFGLVVIQRSAGFRHFNFYQLEKWKRIFKWYYFIESYIDLKSLHYCDYYLIGSLVEYNYLKEKHPEINAKFFNEGIDFTKYRVLGRKEKIQLRSMLGLPEDKILFIAQGNWKSNDYKYQDLLEAYREVKKLSGSENIQLILIGGYKTEDIYDIGIQSGAIMIEKVSKNEFIKYLEACDVFMRTSLSYAFIHNAGIGIATIEALACGLPVITANIIHFPGTEDERKQLGIPAYTVADIINGFLFMKENYKQYINCRKLAQKYYDINDTSNVLINIYTELDKKYYK